MPRLRARRSTSGGISRGVLRIEARPPRAVLSTWRDARDRTGPPPGLVPDDAFRAQHPAARHNDPIRPVYGLTSVSRTAFPDLKRPVACGARGGIHRPPLAYRCGGSTGV